MTLALEKQNTEPLNLVLSHINREGAKYLGLAAHREIESDHEIQHSNHLNHLLLDCSDGIGGCNN